jgi:dTDP-4-dehydrorhamnose reductase
LTSNLPTTVWVTGAAGQLGAAVLAATPPGTRALGLAHADLDLTCQGDITRRMSEATPDYIINCGAYTAVDAAESDRDAAFAVNRDGVRNLALACQATATQVIHISTDFVFAGDAVAPYQPSAQTAPINVYGASKLAGEEALLSCLPSRAMVVRTAWIYSAIRSNFVLTMLRLMAERGTVSVVDDQTGSPTHSKSLARALWQVVQSGIACTGIHHYRDDGEMTWYGFARHIRDAAVARGVIGGADIQPVTSADFPTDAQRPRYSVLDCESLRAQYGVSQSAFADELAEVIDELANAPSESA